MRKFLRLALLTTFIVCLVASGFVEAQTRAVEAQAWNVTIDDIDTAENQFNITELLTLDFTGTFTSGTRDISLSNLESVDDIELRVNGDRLREECRENAGTFCVTGNVIEKSVRYYFPEPITDDTVEVEISYTVVGALRIYAGGDQLQWQAIPQRHSFPVESATVTIQLPDEFAPRQGTDPIASEGAPGTFTVTGSTVMLQTSRPIFANEKFSVRVQYPHDPNARTANWQPESDAAVQYEEVTKPLMQLGLAALAVLVLIGGPLVAYAVWSSRGREVSVTVPEIISEPPADIHPALAGLLSEGAVKTQHILATLFDLARRGYLKIEENRYAGSSSFSFIKSDATPANDKLSYYESHLLDDVFNNGSARSLESMRQSFYREMSSLRRMVTDELTERKYVDPDRSSLERTFSTFQRPMLLIGIALAFFGFTNLQQENDGEFADFAVNFLLFGVALVINALVLRFLSGKISPYTRQGVEARAKTAAFKRFLADREKFRELGYTSANFEKYLPYVIAFNMDREWLQRFQNVQNVESPVWYVPIFVDTTPHVRTDNTQVDLSGVFAGSDERGSLSGSSDSPSLDSVSSGIGSGLNAISLGLGNFLNTAASAMTSAPTPVVIASSSSSWSNSDSGSSWSGSSGSESGGWSSSDSGGGWSGGGDSGGGDSGGGGADFD